MIVFADWDHWVPQMLVGTLLPLIESHKGFELVGVCVPRTTPHWRRLFMYWRSRTLGWLKRLLLNDTRFLHRSPMPVNPNTLARRFGFELLVQADLTDIGAALERLQADVMLSIFWKRRFSAEFLRHFRQAINYHNGSVPDYRGLRATQWSLYHNKGYSGFTIHRINEELDCGNVLAAATVPIDPGDSVFDIELRKTRLAADYLPAILDALAEEVPGTPQTGLHKYNNVEEINRLRRIEEPTSVSPDELLRRIRAFGPVQIRHMHRYITLSGLGNRSSEPQGLDRHVVKLSDGYWTMKRSDRFVAALRTIESVFGRSSNIGGGA